MLYQFSRGYFGPFYWGGHLLRFCLKASTREFTLQVGISLRVMLTVMECEYDKICEPNNIVAIDVCVRIPCVWSSRYTSRCRGRSISICQKHQIYKSHFEIPIYVSRNRDRYLADCEIVVGWVHVP